jgi:uncharacterized membrane protein
MQPIDEGGISDSSRMALWFTITVIGVQIVLALVAYPFLPAKIPSHWDAAGQINGYMPKWLGAFFPAGMGIVLTVFLRGLVAIGPRLGRENQRVTASQINYVIFGLVVLLLIFQVVSFAVALGLPIDSASVLNLVLSLGMILLGNYMGKFRRNFWMGIRTPWTLTSDTVWERTHRLGGWLFVLCGIIGIAVTFVPGVRLWSIIVLLLAASLITVIYSYVIYQRLERARGEAPFSPPFDGSGK